MSDINITVNDEIVNIDVIDTPVLVEVSNAPGPAGAGVAAGGTTGQVLAKASNTNYDTVWVNASGGTWGTITGTLSNQTDLQNALNAKVPYSGATGDVSLGEYGINVGNVIYDTTPTGIPTEQGATYWDTDAETVALIMNGTIQKIGEDTFYHVRNTTGSTIAKGTAVRFSGTTGNSGRLLIAPMLADGTYPSQYYMGITSEEIANNQDGKVYHFGKMRNINTSAFADGDVLYVSPSVAGALTATAPVAPNNIIVAAAVVHAANNGTLMIRTTLGSNINADEGVLLTTPTANQGLFYDSGLWVNKSITTALGYTPVPTTRNITINGVTYDLSADRTWTIAAGISGSGASGQVTYWTGASAVSGSNNLFWDNANTALAIGGTTIDANIALQINSAKGIRISGTGGGFGYTIVRGTETTAIANSGSSSVISSTNTLAFNTGGAEAFRVASNRNISIGTISDLGVRLGVVGDTLLRGSGNTSATTALTVQDSASSDMLRVRSDSRLLIGGASTTAAPSIYAYSGITGNRSLRVGIQSAGSLTPIPAFNINQENDYTYTTGTGEFTTITANFLPTSGTGTLAYLSLKGTINQTGGANGITRGLYVNPTLTAAANWRSIEWSNNSGWGLYGSGTAPSFFNGSVGIGTTATGNYNLRVTKNLTGSAIFFNVLSSGAIQSDVTTQAHYFRTGASSANATFTIPNLYHYTALQDSFGASSTITNQYGFFADLSITGATNNYGFYGNISSGTGRWNLYMNGTADNYLAGNLGIGITPTVRLHVSGDTILRGSGATSATTALTVQNSSSIPVLTARNDGEVFIGNNNWLVVASGQRYIYRGLNQTGIFSIANDNQIGSTINLYGTSHATKPRTVELSGFFSPTSGSVQYSNLELIATINQTGGANGITRGLYVNPTLTAAADFRAIETARGNIVFSNLPTSSAGLPSGALWNNGGVINIV